MLKAFLFLLCLQRAHLEAAVTLCQQRSDCPEIQLLEKTVGSDVRDLILRIKEIETKLVEQDKVY